MGFIPSIIVLLLVAGVWTLIYVACNIADALERYIKNSMQKRKRKHSSPMANNRKGANYER